ncbi:MAG: response regulator [Anaerolineales bacterium]|nr:response regulator [Anaerolineales bacterium]
MQLDTAEPQPNRILVVDDDKIIVEILKQSLTLAGYHVDSASDGEEGLELARRIKPDLILLDVMMPRLDGYSVCSSLKQDSNTQFIPVVILTALSDRDNKFRALEAGADEFIRKPPDRQELLIRIKSLLKTKRLYDQLQSSYRDLRVLQRTKHDLTSMMVHDMRGPLGAIVSSVELLRNNIDSMTLENKNTLLSSSMLASQQIMTMMEAMLDLQRLESGQLPVELEPIMLSQVIDECIQAVLPLLQSERIRIEAKTNKPDELVMLDKDLLTRVINNLLFNAIKFSPSGGRIGVWTQVIKSWIIVNVADQGPGIPQDQRKRIFQKYTQLETNKRRRGIGLGLAFSKMAIEAMKGRIWVEETSRAGALFRFALPYKKVKIEIAE